MVTRADDDYSDLPELPEAAFYGLEVGDRERIIDRYYSNLVSIRLKELGVREKEARRRRLEPLVELATPIMIGIVVIAALIALALWVNRMYVSHELGEDRKEEMMKECMERNGSWLNQDKSCVAPGAGLTVQQPD